MAVTHKIRPMLWFDGKAEEAASFYVSLFPDAKILEVTRFGDTGPGPRGSVMTVSFRLGDQEFVALNGGPSSGSPRRSRSRSRSRPRRTSTVSGAR